MKQPDDTPSFRDLLAAWEVHLRARALSPRTIRSYVDTGALLADYLAAEGHNGRPDAISPRNIEGFMAGQLDRFSAATACVRFRSLKVLFGWLEREEAIERSPMANLRQPRMQEKPVPVLDDRELKALLNATAGSHFRDRRDNALIRMLVDSGVRSGELMGLTLGDLDLSAQIAVVVGKGDRVRVVPMGKKTAEALGLYLQARGRGGSDEPVWLGERGRFTQSGLASMLRRRARQAGICHVHPHRFRHTFAHRYLIAGGREGDLMQLGGWRSREMLDRYGRSAAVVRAHQAFHDLALGDRY